jgi:hypothetical protein
MNFTEYKAALKALGYGITTKTFSFGKTVIYKKLDSGEKLMGNVFNAEEYNKWRKLFEFQKEISVQNGVDSKVFEALKKETDLVGLKVC